MILEFYEEGKEKCNKVHELLAKFPDTQVYRINVKEDKNLPLIDLLAVCVTPTLVFLPSLHTLCDNISRVDLIKAINKFQ